MKTIELKGDITPQANLDMVHDEAQIMRVDQFEDEQTSKAVVEALIGSRHFGHYANAPDIGRTGMAFFEVGPSEEEKKKYFNGAPGWFSDMRRSVAPHQLPADRLRLAMDEAGSCEAHLARLEGRMMFAGLIRVFEAGAKAEPHIDNVGWDAEALGLAHAARFTRQLAANIYHEVDETGGGELLIWDYTPSKAEYDRRRIPGSYGINTDGLPEPTVIRPKRGELIIFDARRVHAVSPTRSRRVTSSMFIGVRKLGKSVQLNIFS